jgi:hypothetical protein
VKGVAQMKIINKLVRNLPGYGSKKEETLSSIFKPLNDIEEKVTIRKQIIEEKILQLKDEKSIIDNQIESFEAESERCDQYLDNIGKFSGVF